MAEKPIPASLESEQALLGAILMRGSLYGLVSHLLDADDFNEAVHRNIWRVIVQAASSGREISAVTVASYLKDEEIVPGVTTRAYLARLVAGTSTLTGVADYARTIRDMAVRRRLISIADMARDELYDGGIDLDTGALAQDVISEIHDAVRGKAGGQGHALGSFSAAVIKRAQDRLQGVKDTTPSTGIADLDQALGGGYREGRLIAFAARPGAGKTVLMCSSARQCAASGHGVKIHSLEIDGSEIWSRITADHLASRYRAQRIEYQRIMNGWMSFEEAQVVAECAREVDQLPIRVDDTSGLTMADIEVRARIDMDRMQRAGAPLRVVMIDFLQLVRAAKTYQGNRVEELGQIAMSGKEMAKRLGICVVMFSQLNRGVEGRDDKRPQISDLRGSGEIEEACDAIGLLYREAYYIQKSPEYQRGDDVAVSNFLGKETELEIALGKNRLGPQRTITCHCDVKFNQVSARAML